MSVTIISNNVPRDIVEAYELTADERAQFDYINWAGIEAGTESASFFRYKGEIYDLGDIPARDTRRSPQPDPFAGWDGVLSDSFFSGILVRYCDDDGSVIVGRFYS